MAATSVLARAECVVFDFGGVLRDTSALLDAGYRAGFAAEGLAYPFPVRETWHIRGVGKYDIARHCIEALVVVSRVAPPGQLAAILSRPDAEHILDALVCAHSTPALIEQVERIHAIYRDTVDSMGARVLVSLYPWAEPSVRLLKGLGHKVALLTNGRRVTVARDLPFQHLFDVIVTENDVANKKPAPDGLLAIVDALGLASPAAAFVCDTAVDIRAGHAAGLGTIAVLSGMGLRPHLELEHPTAIAESVRALTGGCVGKGPEVAK